MGAEQHSLPVHDGQMDQGDHLLQYTFAVEKLRDQCVNPENVSLSRMLALQSSWDLVRHQPNLLFFC